MKKIYIVLLFICCLITCSLNAVCQQQGQNAIKQMITYFNEGFIDSASAIADAHITDPHYTSDPKYWFYDGLIYKDMFKKYERGNVKSEYREKSAKAFQKAMEIEGDTDVLQDIWKNLKYIATTYHNDAVRLLKQGESGIALGADAYNKYIELMRHADPDFNVKKNEIEFDNALGSLYAEMFDNEKDIKADAYYQLAKESYQKVLDLDSSQTSARYNLVVLETNYKTKQERLLKEESERKDQVILSLNAVKELAEARLHTSQLQDSVKIINLNKKQEERDLQQKAEQERKDEIVEKEKQKTALILWSGTSGLLVVIVFAAFMYSNARQKERLNRELAKLSSVVSKSTNTVMIFNSKLEVEWVNNTFFDSYGMSIDEYKQERGTTLTELSTHPEIEVLVKECVEKKVPVSYESEASNMETGRRWFQSILSPIFDEQGKLQNIIVIDSDITALKEIEGELRQKNKDITDSIQYAKRIQQSILPTDKSIKELVPESFIYYKPKDIVSGDFYWMGSIQNKSKIIMAAVDCTGHGVPGALLTIVGNDLLNHIINELGIHDPKDILKEMNSSIVKRFATTDELYSREGMDMAIASLDKTDGRATLSFAGAYNPLYFIRDNQLVEMAPLRYSIGAIPQIQGDTITDSTIEIKKGDVVYLFSDGYADQLNGKTGKKFMKGKFKQLLLDIHKKPLAEQKNILENVHLEWRGSTFQTDDMLIMGFRF